MKVTIEHPYLVFPVNTSQDNPMKKLIFSLDGKPVYDLDIRLGEDANFYCYADMSRFMGKELEITELGGAEFTCRGADSMDRADIYKEKYRPYYHFTEKNGWTNDPNGLVKCGDTYHMFYQYNPCEPRWGNMHWGHATSKDMIHWEQGDIALFPDELGTMYSGSGIVDEKNAAGFGEGALLFFYTAAGGGNLLSEGMKASQNLAYSVDGGKTLVKYEGNPIIPHMIGGNRDPKVIWCEELGSYACVMYLDGNTFGLLTSDDMIHWTKIQEIVIPDAECPDFYPLTADDGTRHWFFSAANARYVVGDIKDGQFVMTQEVRTMHTGSLGYAAQTFSTLPDGRRINIAWDRLEFPEGMPFCSQMSLPIVHSLKKKGNDYVLHSEPVEEVKCLRLHSCPVNTDGAELLAKLDNAAAEVRLTLPAKGGKAVLSMLGCEAVIDLDAMMFTMENDKIPLEENNGEVFVHLFLDKCSVDVFAGEYYAAFRMIADEDKPEFVCSGIEGAKAEVWALGDIH